MRPLRTNAGAPFIASSIRCTPGRTRRGERAATRTAGRLSRAREVEEVRVFGLVELEGARDRLEDGLGDAARVAAFEARVVVDADAGEQRDLFAAEAGTRRGPLP